MWMNSISISFHRCFSYKKITFDIVVLFFFTCMFVYHICITNTPRRPSELYDLCYWLQLHVPFSVKAFFFLKEKETHVKTPFAICKYECNCVYTDVFNHTFLSREIKSHISEMISELQQHFSLVFMSSRCDIKGVYILSMVVNQVSWFCFSSSF